MKQRRSVKIIAFILFFVMFISYTTNPAYAWKLETHVYSGNLLIFTSASIYTSGV